MIRMEQALMAGKLFNQKYQNDKSHC